MRRSLLLSTLVPLALSACDNPAGSEGSGNVAIRFSTQAAARSSSLASYSRSGAGGDQLVISGSNGTLTITDVRFILSEFKLKRAKDSCERPKGDDDRSCGKFEAPPAFVDLPLGGGAVIAATQVVPAGRYTRLKFEVEDIDLDEDDDHKHQSVQALATQVRTAFPEWPEDASMVVVGDFNGTPFTVFFEAEIKVERKFEPALLVDDANELVTVEVAPSAWFLAGGRVIDLSAFDYARTGRVVEFEAKIKDGFTKIEFDD